MKPPRDARPEEIERYERAEIVTRFLQQALSERALFAVALGDEPSGDYTRLLEVDTRRNRLLFDRLRRADNEQRMLDGGAAGLIAERDGLCMWFELARIGAVRESNDVYYTAPLPQRLFRHQRRQFFRVPMPLTMETRVNLGINNTVLLGSIVDVSLGGVCALFRGDLSATVEPGQICRAGGVHLGDELGLQTDMEVRVVRYLEDSDCTRIGLQFRGMPAGDEKNLSRLVLRLQAQDKGKT